MLKNILRSPLIPMILFVLLITFLLLSLTNTLSDLTRLCFWVLVLCTFMWLIFIKLYNRQNPNNQIKPLGIIPPEFRDMDEGQQWVTYKACKNVYIYYSFALPITAGICFLFYDKILVPLICIGVLGIGQYIVYWLTTVRVLNRI
ncbi:hypothetical protein ABET51_19755 [Metabacillus fastidiosus]|uniref:hypothetical protein n=1 Tax=Metabacillus fastidiosus TaxID=1458 RepID=UPI003D26F6A7